VARSLVARSWSSFNCSGVLGLTSSLIRIFLFMSRSKLRGRDVFFLLNKYRERRATMRFNEIANADDQLALWRLISDNVWSAVMAQAKEQERQQAALRAKAAATPKPKPKRIKPQKPAPKKPPAPKPKLPAPKPPPPKSPLPQQARAVTPSRPPPLPSSQPVLRPTHSSSFSQADAYGLQQQTMGPSQGNMPRFGWQTASI
jgi:hypothetical protein